MECVLDVPHVFCVVAPRDLVREADRLHRLAAQLLIEPAIAGAPLVEAWYSPGDGVATLALFGRLPREVGA
jgi:hypothetical protein